MLLSWSRGNYFRVGGANQKLRVINVAGGTLKELTGALAP
jgi:hypothetical protein